MSGSTDTSQSRFEKHPVLTLLLILLFPAFFLVAGAEYYLEETVRQGVENPGHLRYIRLREQNPYYSQKYDLDDYIDHTMQGLEQQEVVFRADENGFVAPSRVHEDPDRTIVFLGGSTTECHLVSENLRFPFLAGRLLEERSGLKINSLNAGKAASHTWHSINVFANKVIPLKPDIAVLMHNFNDLAGALARNGYWSDDHLYSLVVDPVINRHVSLVNIHDLDRGRLFRELLRGAKHLTIPELWSEVVHLLKGIGTAGNGAAKPDPAEVTGPSKEAQDEMVRQFERALRSFVALARIYDITPVLMTQFNRFTATPDEFIQREFSQIWGNAGMTYTAYKALFDRYTETIKRVGREEGLQVIDLEPVVPKTSEYMYDWIHLNDRGAELVSDRIASSLAPLVAR